jgi:outer membrane protein OmpA-like peptidoglycan-associated protein
MKRRLLLVAVTVLLLSNFALSAQTDTPAASGDAFWIAYWGSPRVALYGPEEQAFNQNIHQVTFAHDRFDHALDQDTLNANVQWLKDHPGDRFFIEGYASVTGSEGYNLNLSKQRAEWVREVMIRKGIPENQIVLAVPWGKLYPACIDASEDCHAKNRVVRFAYSPR